MKTGFKISLILNLALLAGLLFMLGRPNQPGLVTAAPPPPQVTAETAAPPSRVSAPPPAQPPAPFRWSQLDDKDYHVYVKNLRAIGCPEPSVRAIAAADVHAVFQVRTREIEKELSNLNNEGSWSAQIAAYKTATGLKGELQAMPDQETAAVADLLGLPMAPVQNAVVEASSAQPASLIQQLRQARPVSPPLVLQDVDLSALNLTADQQQAIADIRADFLQQVGGGNQDPNDPAYRARWQQAQPAADGLLQARLGINGYTEYQELAHQAMLNNQAAQQ